MKSLNQASLPSLFTPILSDFFSLAHVGKKSFLTSMSFSRVLASLVLAVLVALPSVAHAATPKKKKAASSEDLSSANGAYKGAIVIDAASGKTLFEDKPDIVSPPASVTKLMTFAVVSDKIKDGSIFLETDVTITGEESKIGGTQVFLKEKEVFSVEELIYAMMIQSANDAATALARAAGGSRAAFVDLMNAKAHELGMTNTTFRSPHGLPPSSRKQADSDLTSPRDLALLSRYLLTSTSVLKYSSVKNRDFGTGKREVPQHMINHNHLLGKVPGVDGLKTGFTNGAGFCLSATAERGGRRVIVVLMGSTDPKSRDIKVAELIEKGFSMIANTVVAASPLSSPGGSAPTRPSGTSSPLSASPTQPAPTSPVTGTATPPPTAEDSPPTIKFPKPKRP